MVGFFAVFTLRLGICAESAGITALPVLNADVGARPMAMGEAYTALSDDMFGVFYNPSGLGHVQNIEISGAVINDVLDTTLQYLAVALPLSFNVMSEDYSPALGLYFLNSSNGDIDWYKLASDGSSAVSGASRDAGSDNIFALTYADVIYTNAYNAFSSFITVRHFIGATVKFVNSTLPDSDGNDVSASVWAADIGYKVESPEINSSFGISLNNVGGKVKYISEKDPLPRTLRAGLAYTNTSILPYGLTMSFDAIRYLEDNVTRLCAGLEIAIVPLLKIRGGYKFLGDNEGFSVGVGSQIFGLLVDFAMVFDELIDDVYQISATVRFGKRPEKEYLPEAPPTATPVKKKKPIPVKKLETGPAYETQRKEETLLILQ